MAKGKGKNMELARADVVARATEARNGHGPDTDIQLSTGVVLRAVPFSPIVLTDAQHAAVERLGGWPKPPRIYLDDKGREEENPDDPDYKAQKERVETEASMAMNDAVIMRGTVFVSKPKSVPGPEDADWLESLGALGIPVPRHKSARYLYWVKHVAAPSLADLGLIWRKAGRMVGVPEEDVADLVARFPADAQWDAAA